MHGDGGGGLSLVPGYGKLLRKIADEGLCVAAPYSCALDTSCNDGSTRYLEVLKTLDYFDTNKPAGFPIDYSKPYTVAGHSTGGRVALMIAGLIDTANDPVPYLSTVPAGDGLTTNLQ